MIGNFPKLSPLGERAILIEFEPEINSSLLDDMLYYKDLLEKDLLKERVEVVNTYSSLLVNYNHQIEDIYNELSVVEELLKKPKVIKKNESRLFHLPVCYEREFGLDLELISAEKKLPVDKIIELHTAPVYTVFFIGFLPGFLYLGGMDKRLQISRKNEPRMEVRKGAVGIGENQTGIYPKTSPGGWQIIGNSPVDFFDKNQDPPCEISSGDRVKFYPVSREEFNEILKEVQRGGFHLKSEKYVG